ncbi:MAG: type VI secretion system tube protein Hcp [Chitinispirillaceae bacterium]|nr:type VI secretion system tube protein Hcp [Chitinispirillaceae bacterium]
MATPVYIAIFHNNKPLPGAISLHDHRGDEGKQSCVPVLELSHRVWTVKDYWEYCIHYYSRAHGDFSVTIPLNNLAPQLHQFLCRQTFLPKVEIYLYQFDKKARKELEYFRVTMEHVLVSGIRLHSPNTKARGFERYDPMLELSFRYQRITWLFTKGYIIHADEWEDAFDPGEKRDFSQQNDSLYEAAVPLAPFRINPRKLKITEPEAGLEIGKPFEAQLDSLLTRTPAEKNERVVWLSLFSKYKGKVREMHLAEDAKVDDAGNALIRSPRLPENPDWKNDPDRSPDEPVEYWWRAESKYINGYFEGEKVKWPRKEKEIIIPWLIDCHMHINSGHGAPLPLSRDKFPLPFVNRYLSQWALDSLGTGTMGKFGELQKKSTLDLSKIAMEESESAVKSKKFDFMGDDADRRRVMIALPMNMDYAHYRGYEGRPIYEIKDGKTVYWDEGEKKFREVSPNDKKKWENYNKQLIQTKVAFYSSGGSILPFFHYDPRAHLKNWREPFDTNLVQTADLSRFPQNIPAIGIKMYTAMGYRPMDPNMKFPWREYYGLCADKNIPITCHCSRGGMTTHDMVRYYEHEFPDSANAPVNFKTTWFLNEFVSPYTWEKVLAMVPDLRLCLAHFGGEDFWYESNKANRAPANVFWQDLDDLDPNNWIAGFLNLMKTHENVYVDLSYFMFKPEVTGYFKKALMYHPKIKQRLLFGTDWWMYTKEKEYRSESYLKYIDDFCRIILSLNDKEFLEKVEIKGPQELLAYFMVLNPMRFLNLKKVAPMISKAFFTHKDAKKEGWKFEIDSWLETVPESIEELYK